MLENNLCSVLFHWDSSSNISLVLLTLCEWPSLFLPSASPRQDVAFWCAYIFCRRLLFWWCIAQISHVNQTFVTDIPVGVVSLSLHRGTQACHKWLLDATALLCGLATLFPMTIILSACVLHVLILVPVPWWLWVSEKDCTQPLFLVRLKRGVPFPRELTGQLALL